MKVTKAVRAWLATYSVYKYVCICTYVFSWLKFAKIYAGTRTQASTYVRGKSKK